jgi:hypothetical protein
MWLASDYRQMAREVLRESESVADDPDRTRVLLSIAKLYARTALTMDGYVRSSICE